MVALNVSGEWYDSKFVTWWKTQLQAKICAAITLNVYSVLFNIQPLLLHQSLYSFIKIDNNNREWKSNIFSSKKLWYDIRWRHLACLCLNELMQTSSSNCFLCEKNANYLHINLFNVSLLILHIWEGKGARNNA